MMAQVATSVIHEAEPASVSAASWAEPAQITNDDAKAMPVGMAASVTATPTTNPKGIAGAKMGAESSTARRAGPLFDSSESSTCCSVRC